VVTKAGLTALTFTIPINFTYQRLCQFYKLSVRFKLNLKS
jgi:hypothetical protein